MVSAAAVLVPALIQLCGTSVFLKPPVEKCSPASDTSSWIFLLNTLLLCYYWDIFSGQSLVMRGPMKFFLELLLCMLIAEVSSIVVWCRLENLIYRIAQYIKFVFAGSQWPPEGVSQNDIFVLTVVTNILALTFLLYSLDATRILAKNITLLRNWALKSGHSEEQLNIVTSGNRSKVSLGSQGRQNEQTCCYDKRQSTCNSSIGVFRCCYACGKKMGPLDNASKIKTCV